jgi:hypothetical protein
MTVDLLCMDESMREFNQLPPGPDGTQHYLEGQGGHTSNAAIAAARQGACVGYMAFSFVAISCQYGIVPESSQQQRHVSNGRVRTWRAR